MSEPPDRIRRARWVPRGGAWEWVEAVGDQYPGPSFGSARGQSPGDVHDRIVRERQRALGEHSVPPGSGSDRPRVDRPGLARYDIDGLESDGYLDGHTAGILRHLIDRLTEPDTDAALEASSAAHEQAVESGHALTIGITSIAVTSSVNAAVDPNRGRWRAGVVLADVGGALNGGMAGIPMGPVGVAVGAIASSGIASATAKVAMR